MGFILMIFIAIIMFFCAILSNRHTNARASRITTENGIQENIYVDIGGIKQYLEIRGKNKNNPIILWLHGGPGVPVTYLSYYYQRTLEDDFTIVSMEQRGCGRTYFANTSSNYQGELTAELLIDDIDELVDYLRGRLEQEKVIVLGHSWGTILGSRYALEHPEKVLAYIGVAQVIDFDKGKVFAAEEAMKLATIEDRKRLSMIIDKFSQGKNIEELDIYNLLEMINLSVKYLKVEGELPGFKQNLLGMVSPTMGSKDYQWVSKINNPDMLVKLQAPLLDYLYYGFDIYNQEMKYHVPVYFISGEGDWITPYKMVEEYSELIEAPSKGMIIIKNTGHAPFLDNPRYFCKIVKNILKEIK